jgi:hypothetical protein
MAGPSAAATRSCSPELGLTHYPCRGLTAGIDKRVKRRANHLAKVLIAFLGWFVGGLLSYSQLVPLDVTVADRWMYIPIVGLLGVIGVALEVAHIDRRRWKTLAIGVAVLVVIMLSLRTIARIVDWKDENHLLIHDLYIDDIQIKSARSRAI